MSARKMLALAALAALGVSGSSHAAITIGASAVPFTDISTTGTSIGTISDDSETTIAGATLGWAGNSLFAGGVSIRIGNNGGIVWGTSATDTFTGADQVGFYNAGPLNSVTPAGSQSSIPTMLASNTSTSGNGAGIRQFVAPLWDDYTPVSGGTTTRIFFRVVGSNLIVQWNREDAFAATGAGDVTFQAVFYGGASIDTGDTLAAFVYQDTFFAADRYQNDGGSATIGYKNWGLNSSANDLEFGIGGGGTSSTSDPTFASATGMQPKVAGYVASANSTLPNAVSIVGVVIPEPSALGLLAPAALLLARRRRA